MSLTLSALSLFDPFTLSSLAHCPRLSCCPSCCPPAYTTRPRPAPTRCPAQPQTTPHAPRLLCAPTRAPDAAQMPRLCCHAVTRPTRPDRHRTHCEPLYALLSRPRVLYHPSPRTRSERPRNAPVSLATRRTRPAQPRTCAPVHTVAACTM